MFEALRKDSKRWLKELRANDAEAWKRYRAALPQGSPTPTLREVQHALARERGFSGWQQMKEAVEQAATERRSQQELADEMLRQMIWHGDPAIGARLLTQHPLLTGVDFFTAVATGDLEAVRRFLAKDPSVASRAGGPLNWEPLLYLAYSRLPGHEHDALAIARALLDHGADVNACWEDDWHNAFSSLAGVIAAGEGVKPPHPRADELAELFLARGANPYDTQALYNTSIVADDPHWLDVLWQASVAQDVTGKWLAVPATPSVGKTPMHQLDHLLGNAVAYNHLQRSRWLLEHGANADNRHAYSGRPLLEESLAAGHLEMAALLCKAGAPDVTPSAPVAFMVACMQLDREQVRALAKATPQILQHGEPLLAAARHGRRDVVELLLDVGMPVDIADNHGMRALHLAVASDARDVVQLLLDRGALVDTPTNHYGGAMGFAAHFGRHEIARMLAPRSRDVHNLVTLGLKERLAELFAAEPELVNLLHFRAFDDATRQGLSDEDGSSRCGSARAIHAFGGPDANPRSDSTHRRDP